MSEAAEDVPGDERDDLNDIDDEGEPQYPTVDEWVEQVYVTTFIRWESDSVRWCPKWWAHPEAVVRLRALWQTWEVADADTGLAGMANWLRDYLDPLRVGLHDPAGPFSGCSSRRHAEQTPMATEPAPPGAWGLPVQT